MESSEIWAKRVAAWRASGETADAFAVGRGFAGSTLRWWASRAGRRKAAIVQVVRGASRDAALELAVGDVRVLVRGGFDDRDVPRRAGEFSMVDPALQRLIGRGPITLRHELGLAFRE